MGGRLIHLSTWQLKTFVFRIEITVHHDFTWIGFTVYWDRYSNSLPLNHLYQQKTFTLLRLIFSTMVNTQILFSSSWTEANWSWGIGSCHGQILLPWDRRSASFISLGSLILLCSLSLWHIHFLALILFGTTRCSCNKPLSQFFAMLGLFFWQHNPSNICLFL